MISWVKRNKLSSILLLIIGFFLARSLINSFVGISTRGRQAGFPTMQESAGLKSGGLAAGIPGNLADYISPSLDYAPQADVENRLVIEESHLSLLVKNVVETRKSILNRVKADGGYMVNSSVSNPQDAPTGSLVVRVPAIAFEQFLDFVRTLSIKVVSENLTGTDVTDQFVDYEKRIALLEKTKNRFEEILNQAQEISDITNLNREILQIQSQIDALRGQQDALSKNAQMAKLTLYLSTDEIALPFNPSETFRPGVIFKLAVRSLIGHLRTIATFAIWIGVYAVIWIPLILLGKWVFRRIKRF